jgi:amino acid adenylation domain-containing protein/non-ribosomal peptide synthase protein (TIGR01720 family)/FkbM family methyltransferase
MSRTVQNEVRYKRSDALGLKCADQLFEEQAALMPEQIAVACLDRQLTYGELNASAGRLAHQLRAQGVGPNSRIAIAVERSVEMAVAILAALKAGGAYVPLDPVYPTERFSFMLADSQPQVVITQSHVLSGLPKHEAKVILLDDIGAVGPTQNAPNLSNSTSTEDLAYLIYTSGSTGRPKGVMITRGNLGSYVPSIRDSIGITSSDVYLHTASISFSSSVRQLLVPLSTGASVVIATSDEIRDPVALFEMIKRLGVTVIDLVPSYWRSCINALEGLSGESRATLLDNELRLILSASEPLLSDVPKAWRLGLNHEAELINMFGQTETAGIVATYPIVFDDETKINIVPIGSPIGDTRVHLLDSYQKPVAAGEPGEICIGGPTVGRGYLNQAELTAEKFVRDPFSKTPGARLYRTGDLGRMHPDGYLEFVGRIDNQVKIRGHRVEPGEIEAALLEDERVREVVVVARQDEPGSARLVAYIAPHEKASSTIAGRERYRLPNNLVVVQQNKHETDFFYQQIFVDQTNFRHGLTLQDGACVFDVGANIGLFSLFVQQVFKDVTVYAFEPIPAIFEALKINASLYGDSVRLFQCGLAEESKETEFTFYPHSTSQSGRYADEADDREVLRSIIANTKQSNSSGHSGINDYLDAVVENRVSGQKIICQLRTISDIIRQEGVKQIDLLKIDVEKSEADVLAGIADEDWVKIRQIVIEAHDVNGQVARLAELLERHGYSVVVEQDSYLKGSGLYNVYATRDQIIVSEREQVRYQVPTQQDSIISGFELRHQLERTLPDYLIPAAFVILERLPRLPSGKIDRQALPASDEQVVGNRSTFEPARNSVEEKLTQIWSEVLKRESLSVDDNLFELGGDSILIIQIVARANKAGLRLTPKLVFQHQTIAELAAVVGTAPKVQAEQNEITGAVPLTPIQHWFFEQGLPEPHHWNQAFLLEARQALHPTILNRAFQYLIAHHDAMRLRFIPDGLGWRQINATADQAVRFQEVNLSGIPEADQKTAIESTATELQAGLSLSGGPLLRVALLQLGANRASRLLIVIHHLVVDCVSWRILLEDLQTLYRQLSRGEQMKLPSKTTSFKRWAELLVQHANSGTLQKEQDYWLEESRARVDPLPLDHIAGVNTEESTRSVTFSLSVEETRSLLQDVPGVYNTEINDVLLTALVQTFSNWTDDERLLVDLEGHGREDIIEGVDISRTVGWFTTIFPVLLELKKGRDPGVALKEIKEQLRAVPNRGVGYGLTRYTSGDTATAKKLCKLPQAELIFNYLGQFDQSFSDSALFVPASESSGPERSLKAIRRHALVINGMVIGGKLQFTWSYSENLHRRVTIEELVQNYLKALRSLIGHCKSAETGDFTPSDFPLARLDQDTFSRLSAELNKIDISGK